MPEQHQSIPPKIRKNEFAEISGWLSIVAAVFAFAGIPFCAKGGIGSAATFVSAPLIILSLLISLVGLFWPRRQRISVLVAIGLCSIAVIGQLQLLTKVRDTTNVQRCPSNLRQLGLCCLMYATKHGGTFPPSLEEVVLAEDGSPEILVCPGGHETIATAKRIPLLDELKQPGHCSYIYLGAGLKADDYGASDVLAYDQVTNHPEGVYVLFCDGHVEFQTLEGLRDRLKLTHELLAKRATLAPSGK